MLERYNGKYIDLDTGEELEFPYKGTPRSYLAIMHPILDLLQAFDQFELHIFMYICGKCRDADNIFINSSKFKEDMAEKFGKSKRHIQRQIDGLVDKGFLIKTDRRSVFIINPYFFVFKFRKMNDFIWGKDYRDEFRDVLMETYNKYVINRED